MVQRHKELLSIGRFARATRLSHKALRLYDRLGLLQPACVDEESGYRYYRPEQVQAARLIRLLREMEMPLAMIQEVLEADAATAEALIVAYERSFARRLEQVRRVSQQVKRYLLKRRNISTHRPRGRRPKRLPGLAPEFALDAFPP